METAKSAEPAEGHGGDRGEIRQIIAEKFTQSGTWQCDDQRQPVLAGDIPANPGVYLFVVSGRIQYVGSAQKSLKSRTKNYERRQRDQSSTRPVHAELAKAIAGAAVVDAYTLVIGDPIEPGKDSLPIDYAIGLEAGRIQKLDPPWNRRGRKLLLDDIDT